MYYLIEDEIDVSLAIRSARCHYHRTHGGNNPKIGDTPIYTPTATLNLAVCCSGNALVSINAVALHRARLVLGWVTAFGQVNCLIT